MTPLGVALLVGVPLGTGAAAALASRGSGTVLALLGLASVAAGIAVTRPDAPLVIGATELVLTEIGRLTLSLGVAVGALTLGYHHLSGRSAPLEALLPPLLAAIAAGCLFGRDLLVAASFLQLAVLITSLLMIGEQPDWEAGLAGTIYLVLAALGGAALLFGFVLADVQRLSPGGLVTVPFVVATLSVGLALQWGAAPLHAWVPNAVQRAGPISTALAVCLLGPATLGLLLQALAVFPQLVADDRVNRYLTYGGVLTAAFGAAAALAPSKLRRTLGYVLVADLGYVIVGMATYTRIGAAGAVLHMAHRALIAFVLIAAASEIERENSGADDTPAAPYMWGTLVLGTLVLTGVPPLSGFAANWAVLQAVSLSDWRIALALACTSALCLVGLLSALGRIRRPFPLPWRRPRPAERYLMALALFSALWGIVPGPALGAIHVAVSQLPFLRPY